MVAALSSPLNVSAQMNPLKKSRTTLMAPFDVNKKLRSSTIEPKNNSDENDFNNVFYTF